MLIETHHLQNVADVPGAEVQTELHDRLLFGLSGLWRFPKKAIGAA